MEWVISKHLAWLCEILRTLSTDTQTGSWVHLKRWYSLYKTGLIRIPEQIDLNGLKRKQYLKESSSHFNLNGLSLQSPSPTK